MRKLIFTHLFLNLYILALLQPALPFIEYFANYDYIVSELCKNRERPILSCNGKCYLVDQVNEHNNLLGNQEQVPILPKVDLSAYPIFVIFKMSFQKFHSFITLKDIIYLNPKETFQEIIFSIFRPPQ